MSGSGSAQDAGVTLGAPRLSRGLAVYSSGTGRPVLLMPNPQGMVRRSESEGHLARVLLALGMQVASFDPPGAFRSTRPPRLGLREMTDAAREALEDRRPVDVVAHSQATLVALALALESPSTVRRLVLVGPVDGGWRSTRRAHGMPWCWPVIDSRRWRFAALTLPLALGIPSRSALLRFQRFFVAASYADPRAAPPIELPDGPLRRLRWQASIREVDLRSRLPEIPHPVLVCVGRRDPQTPPASAARIAAELPKGELRVFERSGHYPHVEQQEEFIETVAAFLHIPPTLRAAAGGEA